MDNEQLVIQIQNGINVAENMSALWERNKAFIHTLARKYQGYAEIEDLEQEGFLGLNRAVELWDPDAGTAFLTYAGFWIRQRMRQYVDDSKSAIRIPSAFRHKIYSCRKMAQEFVDLNGREPTEREMCQFSGMTQEQIGKLKKMAQMDEIASLDATIEGPDGGETTMGELVGDGSDIEGATADQMNQGQLEAVIWPIVETLPEEQAEVIQLLYREDLTPVQASRQTGASVAEIKSLHRKALRKLCRPPHCYRLRPFMYDYINTQAYHGNGAGTFNRTWTSSTERVALELMEM